MAIVRELVSLFERLRQENKVFLKQPLLDFAFGKINNKILYLDKDHRRLLADAINIYDQGYDFADNNFYYLSDIEPPDNNNSVSDWRMIKNNNYWVSLNFYIPDWLKKVGDNRKKERLEIIKRQNNEEKRIIK